MRSADPSKAEAVGGRIRFQAPRKRFKALRDEASTTSRHDTVALVEGEEGYALALGDQSKSRDACLLKAELERLGGLEKRAEYKERYQTPLWPLCQSLPEVVVNVDKIASLLGEAFTEAPLPSVFSLASVLARDAGPALSKDSLDVLVHGLVKAVSSKDADTASAAARALDYVFKYCSAHLLDGLAETGWPSHCRRHYASLLGAPTDDARLLGARALARLIRRAHDDNAVEAHVGNVCSAVAQNQTKHVASGLAHFVVELSLGIRGRLHTRARSALLPCVAQAPADVLREVLQRIMDATRPGDDIEPLWRLCVDLPETIPRGRALATLACVVRWRRGRLLTPRLRDGSTDDAALPHSLALSRSNQLRALLDAEPVSPESLALLDACVLGASSSSIGPLTRLCNERVGAWLAAAFVEEPVRASRSLEGASRVAALSFEPILSRAASLASQNEAAALVIARRALDASSLQTELPFVESLLQNEDRAIRVAALNVCAHLTSVPRAPVEALLDESDGVVFGAALAALSVIDARAASMKAVRARALLESAAVLEAAVVAVERHPVSLPEALDAKLVEMLASPFTRARRLSRRLLSTTEAAPEITDDALTATTLSNFSSHRRWALRLAEAVDRLPLALSSERPLQRLLGAAAAAAPRLDAAAASTLAAVCVGLLSIRFAPAWASSTQALQALATAHPSETWPFLLRRLETCCEARATPPHKLTESVFNEDDASEILKEDLRRKDETDALGSPIGDDDAPLETEKAHEVCWKAVDACGGLKHGTKYAARTCVALLEKLLKQDVFPASRDDPDGKDVLRHVVESAARTPVPPSTAQRRLEVVLNVFASAPAPLSLPRGEQLRRVYEGLLARPRGDVALLSLRCLGTYRLPHLKPYALRLEALLDDAKLRETLVKFRVAREGDARLPEGARKGDDDQLWTVDDAHRAELIPLITRVLYGRFRARSGAAGGRRGASPALRRATILAFLAALVQEELDEFIRLMFRAFCEDVDALEDADTAKKAVSVNSPARVLGLCTLLRAVVAKLGFKIEKRAPAILSVCVAAAAGDSVVEDEELEDDDDDQDDSPAKQKRRRVAALQCLRDLLERFAASQVLREMDLVARLWTPLSDHLAALSRGGADGTPALLKVVAVCCRSDALRSIVDEKCIAALAGCCPRSAFALEEVCHLLIIEDDAKLEAHSSLIIKALGGQLSKGTHTQLQRRCLSALARVGRRAADGAWRLTDADADELIGCLCARLKTVGSAHDTTIESARESILECLETLLPRSGKPGQQATRLAPLFGPPRKKRDATSFFGASDRHAALRAVATAYVALASHADLQRDCVQTAAATVSSLFKRDEDSIDDAPDYDASAGACADLTTNDAWAALFGHERDDARAAAAPVVHALCSIMRDDDATLRDAAARALRSFVRAAASMDHVRDICRDDLVPHVLDALALADDSRRRAHVSVLAVLVDESSSTYVPRFVALKQLRDASNRDLDVFENVAHLQAHRRARAFAKAADWITSTKDTEGAKILLPLALQPLSDASRDGVHADAARCVGALGGALPWSRYAALLKRLATVIDRQAAAVDRFSSKEKKASAAPGAASRKEKPSHQQQRLRTSRTLEATFVSAFCHALDCFPFSEDVVGGAEEDDDDDDEADAEASKETPLSRGVATFLVPTARRLLMRPERRAKTGARDEVLRPPVALSILRLARKLPRDGREVARQLVVAVCASLRHRDATKRDASRKALARMAAEGASLALILTELRAALPTGYMLAVRSAAVHSLLEKARHPLPSETVGVIASLLVEDLLGDAAAARDGREDGEHKAGSAAGVPEARLVVGRTYESLELCGRLITYAQKDELATPLFDALDTRLAEPDARGAREAQRCRAAALRLAAGLAANPEAPTELVKHAVEVLSQSEAAVEDEEDSSDSDDDGDEPMLAVVRDEADLPARRKPRPGSATQWLPSHGDASSDAAAARRRKRVRETEAVTLLDGASAPRLTGRGRRGDVAASSTTRRADRARFAVALLRRGLPKGALAGDAGDLLGLLARCYRGAKGDDSLQTDVVIVAAALLKRHPDGARRWAPRLARVALQTLRRVAAIGGAPTGDAAEGAFRMLAALLGGKDAVVLSDAKLKAVAASGRAALADGALLDQGTLQSHRAAALQLILALVTKKVVVSEVYDAMDTIADLAITSLDKSDRTKCAKAFVGFIVAYPLGKKRKTHYLGKALAGLDYAYEEGRTAALELVMSVARSLPQAELDARSDAFFSALAQRLANEDVGSVRLARFLRPVGCLRLPLLLVFCLSRRWRRGGRASTPPVRRRGDARAAPNAIAATRRLYPTGAPSRRCASRAERHRRSMRRRRNRSQTQAAGRALTALLRKLSDEKRAACRGRVASWLREASKEERLERFAEAEKVARLRLCGAACAAAFARMGDAALCGDVVRALAASSDDDAGRAELLRAARVCVEADATVCDGKVLAAVLASLQKCGPLSRRAAHEALGAVFASGRCDLEEVQARDVCRAACAALDAPDDVFDESVATQAAKNALYAAGHHSTLASDILKRLADAAGRRGAGRRKAVFAFVAACLAHSTIGTAPVRAALDRVCAALRRALDDDNVDVAAFATDVVGRLEDALGADVVGRALAEAAAAQRRKRSGRVAEAAREKVVDPRGAAKRRRGDRRSK